MTCSNIVLLGIGHTNAHVVKEWVSDPIPGCTLTCISKFPTATYSGMLPGTLGQQFSDDEMRIDLQRLVDRAGAKLILADTCGLDLETGEVHFSDHDSIPFNALSIGVGSMPARWKQQSESPLLVTIKPMQTFLSRLSDRLKCACADKDSTLRIAIVGGGVASVEIAFCLHERLSKNANRRDTKIEIFTSSERIADGMRDRSIRRIEKLLASRDIHVRAGHRVVEVGETDIVLDDGCRKAVDCVIWATGAAAPTVLGTLGLQTDDRGFIATNNRLQSLTDPRVFAVGDAGTVIQSPSPKAGVYAVRQCPILWHNLHALITGGPMRAFKPQRDFLKLLNTGDGKALLEYGWLTAHARWCWALKTWIDKKFVNEFKSGLIPRRGIMLMKIAMFWLLTALCLLHNSWLAAQESAQQSTKPAGSSVPAGINDNFKNPDLNVDEWIERFEVESREVYAARDEVLEACEIRPGERVADVGAGTGFYSRLFAKATGWDGWVYSVDIAPRFLQHIALRATGEGIENLTPVLGTDVSIRLPPESMDLVFICDTYHHFESPQQSLASIYRALKPGGRLVLIDFNRIPGVSREFLIGHVRASKEVFRSEIIDAGFEFTDEIEVKAFEENYLLRFTKPKQSDNN